jgi:hypothetical protein
MADNQTHEEWLAIPSVSADSNAIGTVVYRKTSSGAKLYMPNTSYERAIELGNAQGWHVFSWIPEKVASQEQVQSAVCSGRCVPGSCPPGCLCSISSGQCE